MSSITTKFFPIDENNGYLQLLITIDEETKEELGKMDEGLAMLTALQYLYSVAVLNFGGEAKVNEILRETIKEEESESS